MLAREVSRILPGGHLQSLDDDARGGGFGDAPGASLRDASIAQL